MNLTRPEVGWLSRVKLYDSERPKPVEKQLNYATLPEAPTTADKSPEALDSLKRTNNRTL